MGKLKNSLFPAFQEGWAWAEREWTKVTKDTGIGSPAQATEEKGKAFFKFITEKIGAFLFELAIALPEEMYKDPD